MSGDLAQRQQARRRALLDVGIELLGAEVDRAVNVRSVCRSTGITERYFYALFHTRDRYVRAVYDDVARQAREALSAAVDGHQGMRPTTVAAVDAFIGLIIGRPDMGRALLLGPRREQVLSQEGLERMHDFFAFVADAVPGGLSDETRQLVAVEIVGALTALFTQFLSGRLEVGRQRLAEYCVDLILTAIDRVRPS